MRLIVSQAAGVESQHIPGGYSLLRLQETALKPPAPRCLLTDCRTVQTIPFHNPMDLSSPPVLASTVVRDLGQSQTTTGKQHPDRGASSVPCVARLVLWLIVS